MEKSIIQMLFQRELFSFLIFQAIKIIRTQENDEFGQIRTTRIRLDLQTLVRHTEASLGTQIVT
jgi:hypothetical protein